MDWLNYLKAPKPRRAIYFLEVLLGALFVLNFNFFLIDWKFMLLVFISFQIFYFGIYIINDIIDYKEDRKKINKSRRIIASRFIKRYDAIVYAVALILIGLFLALFISPLLVFFESLFLLYNLTYTLLFKKIRYFESFCGGIPHALRLVMGASLFGAFNQYFLSIAFMLFVSALTFVKKIEEEKYSLKELNVIKVIWFLIGTLILIFGMLSMRFESESIGIFTLLVLYLILIVGYLRSKKIKNLFISASNY